MRNWSSELQLKSYKISKTLLQKKRNHCFEVDETGPSVFCVFSRGECKNSIILFF